MAAAVHRSGVTHVLDHAPGLRRRSIGRLSHHMCSTLAPCKLPALCGRVAKIDPPKLDNQLGRDYFKRMDNHINASDQLLRRERGESRKEQEGKRQKGGVKTRKTI